MFRSGDEPLDCSIFPPVFFPFKKRNVVANPIEIESHRKLNMFARVRVAWLFDRPVRSGPVQLTGWAPLSSGVPLGLWQSRSNTPCATCRDEFTTLRLDAAANQRRAQGKWAGCLRARARSDGRRAERAGSAIPGFPPLLPAAMWPCLFLTEKTPRHSNGTVDLLRDQHVYF